jgi:hypothetical protein
MLFLKNLLIFLAGAMFFHGFSHMIIPYLIRLPLATSWIVLTDQINFWAIVGSFALSAALLLATRFIKTN